MKVLIPVVDSLDQKETIASSFNATMHVCLFDTELESISWLETDHPIHSEGNLIDEMVRLEIGGVITQKIQTMAYRLFRENGIKIYCAEGSELAYNLDLFIREELPTFSMLEALGGCSTSCSDCASTKCSN